MTPRSVARLSCLTGATVGVLTYAAFAGPGATAAAVTVTGGGTVGIGWGVLDIGVTAGVTAGGARSTATTTARPTGTTAAAPTRTVLPTATRTSSGTRTTPPATSARAAALPGSLATTLFAPTPLTLPSTTTAPTTTTTPTTTTAANPTTTPAAAATVPSSSALPTSVPVPATTATDTATPTGESPPQATGSVSTTTVTITVTPTTAAPTTSNGADGWSIATQGQSAPAGDAPQSTTTPAAAAPTGTAAQPTITTPAGPSQTGSGPTIDATSSGDQASGTSPDHDRRRRQDGQDPDTSAAPWGAATPEPSPTTAFAEPTLGGSTTSPQPSPSSATTSSPPASTASGSASGSWDGWASGASGDDATTTFGTWRGSPVGIVGTWADSSSASDQADPASLSQYADWDGDLDVSVGGTVLGSGESYAQAAAGAYTDRWTQLAEHLQAARAGKGTTYVRPFEEFNGDWYGGWQVTTANLADYQAAFRLFATTLRSGCPSCKVVWNPNNGTSSGSASPVEAYPGDAYVDVIGVDSYNANGATVVDNSAAWTTYADAAPGGIPEGPEAWRQFAASHGKPIAFPEWGLNHGGGGGDDPAYIQGFHDWMSQNAARPGDTDVAGKVVYDIYFDIDDGNSGFMITGDDNPQSAAVYKTLTWGNTTGTGSGSGSGTGNTDGGGAQGAAATTESADDPTTSSSPTAAAGPDPTTGPSTGTATVPALVDPAIPSGATGTAGVTAAVGVTAAAQTDRDVAYATSSSAQKLDLYLPRRSGTAVPLVVDIHGGAFSGGDKTDSDITSDVPSLLAAGYAVASINYRLDAEAAFPAQIQDTKAATRWLRAHASAYGIDPDRFAAWGQSAGGYLAAMLAVTGDQANTVLDDASLGNAGVSSAVQAVVGEYAFVSPVTVEQQQTAAGCTSADVSSDDATDAQLLGSSSPDTSPDLRAADVTAWIPSAPAGSLPPMYLAHGTADCTVPIAQAQQLQSALVKAGDTAVTLDPVQGAGHADPTIVSQALAPAVAFLDKTLTPTTDSATVTATATDTATATGTTWATAPADTATDPGPVTDPASASTSSTS